MLRRLGNKKRMLPKFLALFPEHITTFIDMFMGSGSVTFAMVDRAKYIIANDNDEEVFNLFLVVKEHREELIEAIQTMPVHEKLFKYWQKQQEYDCVWRATRFLMRSHFGAWGQPATLNLCIGNDKTLLMDQIKNIFISIEKIKFTCCDFRDVLNKIHTRHPEREKQSTFIYADPPYTETGNNYKDSFTEQQTQDLFELLTGSGIRFALSEFDNPFVLDLAQSHGLYVTELGERRNLKNRRTEILITNYEPVKRQVGLFDVTKN